MSPMQRKNNLHAVTSGGTHWRLRETNAANARGSTISKLNTWTSTNRTSKSKEGEDDEDEVLAAFDPSASEVDMPFQTQIGMTVRASKILTSHGLQSQKPPLLPENAETIADMGPVL